MDFDTLMQAISSLGGAEESNPGDYSQDYPVQQNQQQQAQPESDQQTVDMDVDSPEAHIIAALVQGRQIQLPGLTLDFSNVPEELRGAFGEVVSQVLSPEEVEELEEPEDEESEETADQEAEESPDLMEPAEQQVPPPATQTSPLQGPGERPPPETTGPVELHAAPLTNNKSKEQDKNYSKTKKEEPPKKKK